MLLRIILFSAVLAIASPVCARKAPKAPVAPSSAETAQLNSVESVEAVWSRIRGPAAGRHAARMALAPIGAAAIPVVQGHYASDDWQDRWEVVNALGVIGDSSAADFLVKAVTTDDNLHVRWRGLWALAAVANPDSTDKLRRVLKSDDRKTRWNAAVGLAFFRQPEATPILAENLKTTDEWERWEAINGLGQVFDDKTSALLIDVLPSLTFSAQREAVMALGRIGDQPALDALVELVGHANPELQWRAAAGLANNNYQAALPSLKARLQVEKAANVREEIQKAIARLEGKASTPDASVPQAAAPEPALADATNPAATDWTIERQPDVAGCRPTFRGTNILVEDVLRALATAQAQAALLEANPRLTQEHLHQALAYAADVVAGKGPSCPGAAR